MGLGTVPDAAYQGIPAGNEQHLLRQVLQCPYSFEKARLVVREMVETIALDLLEKKLVTDQLTLTVGYGIENTAGGSYHGETVTDRYGRKIPKHAHETANLPRRTSSARSITLTVNVLGYPGKSTFKRWLNKAFPNRKKYCISGGAMIEFPQEIKEQAVIDLCARAGSAKDVAEPHGVSQITLLPSA